MINDVFQVVIGCRFGDQLGLNVRHYFSFASAGTGAVTLTGIANGFAAALGPLYQGVLSESAEFRGVVVQKIKPLPMGMPALSSLGVLPGLRSGDPLPRQIAGLISFQTAFAGRRMRGRSYIPFPAESDNEPDTTPSVTYITALSFLAAQLISLVTVTEGANSEQLMPVIFHRDTTSVTQILTATANDAWATQRRRGSFGRPNALIGGSTPIVPIAP